MFLLYLLVFKFVFNFFYYFIYLRFYFEIVTKRDVFEFLIAFCTKYDYIQNLVGHQIIVTCRCNSYGDTKIQKIMPFFQFLLRI